MINLIQMWFDRTSLNLSLASKISPKVWVWSNSPSTTAAVRKSYSSSLSFSLVTRSCQGLGALPSLCPTIFIIGPCQQYPVHLSCTVCYGSYCALISTHASCETVCMILMCDHGQVQTRWMPGRLCGWNKKWLDKDQRGLGTNGAKFFQTTLELRDATHWGAQEAYMCTNIYKDYMTNQTHRTAVNCNSKLLLKNVNPSCRSLIIRDFAWLHLLSVFSHSPI